MKTDTDIDSDQLNPATASVLRRFSARRRRLLWIRAIAVGVLALATTMTVVMLLDFRWLLPTTVRFGLSAAGYVCSIAAMWWISLRFLKQNDPREIARQLETVDPRLREDLLSAVELSTTEGANGSADFRQRLQLVVARRAAGMDVAKLLPLNLLRPWTTAAGAVMLICFALLMIPPLQVGRRIARAMLPGLAIERASMTQIEIIKPEPATGFVAIGDAAGVTAKVFNLTRGRWVQWISGDDVVLQYCTDHAKPTEVVMSPRTLQKNNAGDEFAANLMIRQTPVHYRIIAGDAVTLWHTLTPLSRPHATSFDKEYIFPAYAHLPNETVREGHGDLRAVAGTLASVTAQFDEPVTDAIIRMNNRRSQFKMTPVEGSSTVFRASIPINTPSQYQVDAVSKRSGLSNPFGRQYSISPVIDSPPIVRWDASMLGIQVVSPIDVVSLSAEVVDDLPIDRVLQKSRVNGKDLPAVPIQLEENRRRHQLSLQWDLFNLGRKLASGDIVQTRLVAVDRLGQMVDSGMIEFLIAEKGFDSQRHEPLDRLHRLTLAIHQWFSRAQPATSDFDPSSSRWPELQAEADALVSMIETELERAAELDQGSFAELSRPLNLIGRALVDWQTRIAQLRIAPDRADVKTEINSLAQQTQLLDAYARSLFSQALTVGLIADAISLRRSLVTLLDPDSQISAARYPRYLNVIAGRLDAMDTLIATHSSQLQESSFEQFGKWSQWSDRWTSMLREMSDDGVATPAAAKSVLERLSLFDVELQQQTRHTLVDGRLVSSLSQCVRELNRTIRSTSQILQTTDDEAFAKKVATEVSLERRQKNVDLRYIADLNLLKGAVAVVGGDGFVDIDGLSTDQVYEKLASAMQLLTAAHRIDSARREVSQLAMYEQRLSDSAVVRIDHPVRLERFSTEMEHTVELLKSSGIDWSLVDPIDRTRYGDDFAEARDRVTRRRWSEDELQSGSAALNRIHQQLKQSLDSLAIPIQKARLVLSHYAPTIPQLALAAAEEVETQQTALKSDDVIEALNDFANNADLLKQADRGFARDADSAAAQIAAAKEDAALDRLAEVLRKTGEHFENVERGEDVSESRNELRSGERSMEMSEWLDERLERTETIADAAAKTPEELLKQLEEQLRRNEPMQEELDDIAQRTEEAVQRDLENLARDEDLINAALESSDPAIRESVRRASQQLVEAARRLRATNQSLVVGAQRSSNWGNLTETRQGLEQATQTINEAVELLESLSGDKNPMSAISDTAMQSTELLQRALAAMESVADEAEKATSQNLHQNDVARIEQKLALERFERDARRQRMDGPRMAELLWKGEKNAAKQRAKMQQRLSSDALRQAENLRQLADNTDDEAKRQEIEKQIDQQRKKNVDAQRATAAAEDTERFAQQRIGQAIEDRREIESEKLAPLDDSNPAAQLTQRMSDQAIDDLKSRISVLKDAALRLNVSEDLLADSGQAKTLAQRQSRVTDDVQEAAADLHRASRHQKRLAQDDLADKLSGVADQIQQRAKIASQEATKRLSDAAETPSLSPQANRQVAQAKQEILAAQRQLAGQLEAISDNQKQDAEREMTDQQNQSARQLAQTLDELDRSIARSKTEQQYNQQRNSDQQNESTSQNQNAGEASPTLMSALDAAKQQVARGRQQSTQSGKSGDASDQAGDPSDGDGSQSDDDSQTPGTPGAPPGGPSVPIAGIDLDGSDWGQLRSRTEDDAAPVGRVRVPNQYRREIEAYFRAIADQSKIRKARSAP